MIFYRKLRFFFLFHLNKSSLRVEDCDENMPKNVDPEALEDKKLFLDKSLELFSATKFDFFNICSDMGILSEIDFLKSTLS